MSKSNFTGPACSFNFCSTLTRRISTYLLWPFALICFAQFQSFAAELSSAEPGGTIRAWHTADGLPVDSVTAIVQTRDGYLWVGTSAGLVRFDGVKFTRIPLLDFPTNKSLHITALCEDSENHLWIGTQQNGLFELDGNDVRHFTKSRELLDDTVTSLAADQHGFVWIGTRAGLNLFTGRDFRSFGTREGLPDELVSGVHVARSGTVWITTRSGMCRFINGRITPYAFQTGSQGRSPEYLGAYEDRRGNLWAFGDTYLINLAEGKRFNYFRGSEAASMRIWSLCEGRDGTLWIGTSGRGLFCFGDNRFQPVVLGELRWPYDVRAIYEDREGNLWLGTTKGGLVQLSPQPAHVLKAGHGLPSGAPAALAMDSGGKIHVGLQRGGIFVSDAGRFDRLSGNGGDVQDFVSSMCIASNGTVWAGTLGGGLYGLRNGQTIRLTTANGLADDTVLAVCADKSGNVWSSTAAGTLHRFDGKILARFDRANGLTGSPVIAMSRAIEGGLWLGTRDGFILRGENGKFSVLKNSAIAGRHPILALHESAERRLWIGTAGGGLICLETNSSRHWNLADGLPASTVAGVAEDAAKNLWLATSAGIYRVNKDAMEKALRDPASPLVCKRMSDAKTFSESATLTGGPRSLLSPDGKLWFATSEGVLTVDTDQPEFETATLSLYIESAAFNGQRATSFPTTRANTNSVPMIAPGEVHSLELHFTALSFIAPEKIRFRHKLEGFDADWIDDAGARFVRYGRLPYGDYRFRVAARISDGAWHEAATSFAFIVPTPVYLQSWAIALYGIAAVALIVGIVRVVSHRRLRGALALLEQQQALERERMRIARDMHDDMGSKLTKISFLSEHAKVDAQAKGPLAGKIESIAETSRELLQSMDEIVWVVNPRNDTLEHLVAYFGHYAVEYFQNTSIECDLRLPRAIPDHPLSSETRHNLFLTFEEILNNVLKHSRAAKVKVEMTLHADIFEIKVADDGCGFDTARLSADNAPNHRRNGRGGNGLKNMRQRLTDVGGEFLVRSEAGAGTTIVLRIPLAGNKTRKS